MFVCHTLRPGLDFLVTVQVVPCLTSAIVLEPPSRVIGPLGGCCGVGHAVGAIQHRLARASFRRAVRGAIGMWHCSQRRRESFKRGIQLSNSLSM